MMGRESRWWIAGAMGGLSLLHPASRAGSRVRIRIKGKSVCLIDVSAASTDQSQAGGCKADGDYSIFHLLNQLALKVSPTERRR